MTASPGDLVHMEVPEEAFSRDTPLVAVMRGQYVGSLHRGTIAAVSATGRLTFSLGDPTQPVFLRSAAKPFQVMPAVLAGAVEKFGITSAELAVLCASHNAEPAHTRAVLSVLHKIGLDETALHCGVHPPLHEETARRLWREGRAPTPVCNNCSGAHSGMLLACRARGWPVENYGSPDHPLQVLTRDILASFAGLSEADITFATDNCHVPTFRLPLQRAAQAFARLVDPAGLAPDLQEAAGAVVSAMTSNPDMVGGERRFDTDLMVAARGAIVAKGGAEGFQGVGLRQQRIGLALKVSDGNSRAISPAILPVLANFGALDQQQLDRLSEYSKPILHDLEGEVIGKVIPVFSLGALQ